MPYTMRQHMKYLERYRTDQEFRERVKRRSLAFYYKHAPKDRKRKPHRIRTPEGNYRCSKCFEEKPPDQFYPNSRTGKPQSWCKTCESKDSTRRRRIKRNALSIPNG